MPTAIGAAFFLLGGYSALVAEENLVGLLLISSVFQAASAINFGDRGIQPYYIVAFFIIARGVRNWVKAKQSCRFPRLARILIAFAVIAAATSIALPLLFAGIPVYDPKIGIDDGLFLHPPLHLNLNNLAQAGFLVFNVLMLLCISSISTSNRATRRAYITAFYIVVLIIFTQALAHSTGITLPDSLLRNNPGYSISDPTVETRPAGPFAEPSFAGAFLIACFAGFLKEYLSMSKSLVHLLSAIIATAIVASSGSMFVFMLFALSASLRHFPLRFPWHLHLPGLKRQAALILLILLPLLLLVATSPSFRESLTTLTLSKSESGSFIHRTAADLFALKLVAQTHGLGVGLGSNRASSLIASLLSNVGIIGFLAFVLFLVRVFRNINPLELWKRWALLAVLLDMCLDIPDVTFPILWVFIILSVDFSIGVGRFSEERIETQGSENVTDNFLTSSQRSPLAGNASSLLVPAHLHLLVPSGAA